MILSGSKNASEFEKGVIGELGKLIDGNLLDFEKHIEKADYGYCKSLDILLEQTYLSLLSVRDDYLTKLESQDLDEKTKEKLHTAIEHIYAEMMKIEHKSMFLNDWLKKNSLSAK